MIDGAVFKASAKQLGRHAIGIERGSGFRVRAAKRVLQFVERGKHTSGPKGLVILLD
jgi:hypothetical protein